MVARLLKQYIKLSNKLPTISRVTKHLRAPSLVAAVLPAIILSTLAIAQFLPIGFWKQTTVLNSLSLLAGSLFGSNGTGGSASFIYPQAVAIDTSGNLFIADDTSIRKVTPAGVETTFAGTPGIVGSADGTGTSASFRSVSDIAIDSTGNFFVTDQNVLRKITAAGVVTTIAGTQVGADGTGNLASMTSPQKIAIDSGGNLFVTDMSDYTIRKVSAGGVVTTFAGKVGELGYIDGSNAVARLNYPLGVAVDSSGNTFVTNSNAIRKITSAGVVSTFAGNPSNFGTADGTGTAATFSSLGEIATDSGGNIYVADTYNNLIRKVTSAGVVTTFAGSPANANGTGTAARFSSPYGTATDTSGNVYVADTINNLIRKITPAGVVTTLAGSGYSGSADGTGTAASFSMPIGLAVDSAGNIFVADNQNNTIRKITSAGVVTTFAGSPGVMGSVDGTGAGASFAHPRAVAVDTTGNVFVADTDNMTIRQITSAGVVSTFAGTAGVYGNVDGTGSAASFGQIWALTIDGSGNLYCTDYSNSEIRKITAAGVVTTLAGTGVMGSSDGVSIATAPKFYVPKGSVFDGSGNLFVADSLNHTIRKITSAGVVTTFAGAAGVAGTADGTGTAANFSGPSYMVKDSSGNLYVSDTNNSTIRKITSAGVVTTFAGTAGAPGYFDATGNAAKFYYPQGLAIDSTGNLYVADMFNNVIRKITSAGVVSTFAGIGIAGSADGGTATSSTKFDSPYSTAVDSSGNIYVVDGNNNVIRKITSTGVITTFAGTVGVAGSADGTGTAAKFNMPMNLTIDSSGNLYVSDSYNCTIRKITSAAVVTTIAGTAGTCGTTNGTGAAASFMIPTGIARDTSGNLYVADRDGFTIRKITPAGVVTTLAGTAGFSGSVDGTGTSASFNKPEGLAVDASGNLFVADNYNNKIRKITPAGIVTTFAGSGTFGATDGTGVAALFGGPTGLTIDSAGNLYVAEMSNYRIRKITSSGVTTTLAGSGGTGNFDGTGLSATFNSPRGLSVDSSGNLYVADTQNETIRKVTANGVVTTIAGTPSVPGFQNGTGTAAAFNGPLGLTIDSSGNLYVTDYNNNTIRKVTSGGVVTTLAGTAGQVGSTDGTGAAARFNYPSGIVADSSSNLYVTDIFNHNIRKISSSGVVTTLAGLGGWAGALDGTGSAASFNSPQGISIDSSNNLFVSDGNNNTIRKVTLGGVVTTFVGTAGIWGTTDGGGVAATFNGPQGIAVDSSGNVYVGDSNNQTIRKISTAGVVTTLAGQAGAWGATDGTGSAARFNYPTGLSKDASNNLYLADMGNNAIRKISTAGVVTTFAGKAPSVDGTGSAATFNNPIGMAVDSSGNVYVADTNAHLIRKITSAGVVTTLAGTSGISGSVDATGASAMFNYPQGLATDSAGNVYVADTGNNSIRKITSAGVVTTLAGLAGSSGAADGTGTAARFNFPNGLVVDASNNVYVTDTTNRTVRKITSGGVVTTLAGAPYYLDGTGAAARFSNAHGLALDSGGNIYVADSGNSTIRKVTSAGVVTTLAGTPGVNGNTDGNGSTASFSYPIGIAVDSGGNIFVADSNTGLIRQVTAAGVVTTFAGGSATTGADGVGTAANFNEPNGLAIDSTGNLYVADTFSNTIRKVTPSASVTTLAGSVGAFGGADGTGATASFHWPKGLAVDSSGNVFVADTENRMIRKITAAGVVTTLAGAALGADGTGAAARFYSPYSAAPDTAGNLYVADTATNTIRKVTPAGVVTTLAGSAGVPGYIDGTGGAARFNVPQGIAVDASGNIFVADSGNHIIRKITPAGVVSTFAGAANSMGALDGTGTAARFNYPQGLAVDSSGNLFVVDRDNYTVRKITAAGVVTTLAGSAGVSGNADGTGAAARFGSAGGMAIDSSGNLYVVEIDANTIRKITSAGVVTTLAGSAGFAGSTDGTGAAARFNLPFGVAVDTSGNLFVADYGNNKIRKITSAGVVTTVIGNGSPQMVLGALPGSIAYPMGVTIYAGKLYIIAGDAIIWCNVP